MKMLYTKYGKVLVRQKVHLQPFIWVKIDRHGGVMIRMLASSVVDSGFGSRSDQIKVYKVSNSKLSSLARLKAKYNNHFHH